MSTDVREQVRQLTAAFDVFVDEISTDEVTRHLQVPVMVSEMDQHRPSLRRLHRTEWSRFAVATAAATLLVGMVVTLMWVDRDGSDSVSAPMPPTTLTFAEAIEASEVMTIPSDDEVAQATNGDLYRDDFAEIQISEAGFYVALRKCRDLASSTCGTGWAYMTGSVDGVEVHGGLLGEASQLDLQLLDDRYFVASESAPNAQAPARAWLIDAVSGKVGALSWRDEPTTLNSPEQALLLCQEGSNTHITPCAVTEVWDADHEEEFTDEISSGGATVTSTYVVTGAYIDVPTGVGLPKVVDGRDGTIRPLAMPDDVVASVAVAQHGASRLWVGTAPAGVGFGLAYSDDGGATWSEVALPEPLASSQDPLDHHTWLSIAADGDRVAVAKLWGGDTVYVSDDAGQNWTTATASEPGGNGAHLYVLADGRLVLMWSVDAYPKQLLVSIGSGWAELDEVDGHFLDSTSSSGYTRFGVNRAGIALTFSFIYPCDGAYPCPGYGDNETNVLDTVDFSSDLANWRTVNRLND